MALLFDYDRLDTRFLSSRRGTVVKFPSLFLVGAVMGMTSIGGGILIIPSLLLFYRETSRYVGTSIFVALLLMAVMSTLYALIGRGQGAADVDLTIAVFMSAGSLAGVHYGVTHMQADARETASGRRHRGDRRCGGDDAGGPVLVDMRPDMPRLRTVPERGSTGQPRDGRFDPTAFRNY